jgi:shikimate dehydrogenase
MLRCGLLGEKLGHSWSPAIHAELGDYEYKLYEKSPEEVEHFLRSGEVDGLNVTIPYKKTAAALCAELSPLAKKIGSVNAVVRRPDGTLYGDNTDAAGFLGMLERSGISPKGKKVLVLGGGGSGRSTAAALKNAGASVSVYQRRREKLEELCAELQLTAADDPERGGFDILVNCTGVGMHDTEGVSPVSEKAFAGAKWAIDLIYSPSESEFLRLAKGAGLKTLNGAAMLFYQAYFADCLYLGRTPSDAEAEKLYEKYLRY